MKYIKSYQIFENNSDIDNIKDLILPISDKGFRIFISNDEDEWGGTWFTKDLDRDIRIEVLKIDDTFSHKYIEFNITEIKEDLEFLCNYINSYLKFNLVNIYVTEVNDLDVECDKIDEIPIDITISKIEIDFEKI